MPPEQPLLTIAIPTYNRSLYLAQLLKALAPQLKDEPRVELIISDNASPDDTPAVIQQFMDDGLKVRYIRNAENIGPDRNFIQCFEEAAGRYVWMIGDDDVVLEGVISRILGQLAADDYDLVYLTPCGFREHPSADHIPDTAGIHESVFTDATAFARQVGTMFTLITCNIVSKEALGRVQHQPFSSSIGTNFTQLSWTYPLLTQFSKGLYVHDTCVAIRNGTSGGYSVARVFGNSLKLVTENLLAGHPEVQRAIYSSAVRGILPLAILQVRQRTHGNFEEDDFHKLLKPVYGKNYEYWLWVYPIARAPLWLASTWFHCIRSVVSMRTRLRSTRKILLERSS